LNLEAIYELAGPSTPPGVCILIDPLVKNRALDRRIAAGDILSAADVNRVAVH